MATIGFGCLPLAQPPWHVITVEPRSWPPEAPKAEHPARLPSFDRSAILALTATERHDPIYSISASPSTIINLTAEQSFKRGQILHLALLFPPLLA
jgi:hypothetical protein